MAASSVQCVVRRQCRQGFGGHYCPTLALRAGKYSSCLMSSPTPAAETRTWEPPPHSIWCASCPRCRSSPTLLHLPLTPRQLFTATSRFHHGVVFLRGKFCLHPTSMPTPRPLACCATAADRRLHAHRAVEMSSPRRNSILIAINAMAPRTPAWTAWCTLKGPTTEPIRYVCECLPLPLSPHQRRLPWFDFVTAPARKLAMFVCARAGKFDSSRIEHG